MIQFPEQRIAREVPVDKLWRWWTPKGWSWDINDKYQSLTIKNGDSLRIPIFFDRAEVKSVDVFQVWLNNVTPKLSLWMRLVNRLKALLLGSDSFYGYLDPYIDGKKVRRIFLGAGSVPNWGTLLVLNFDDSEIMQRGHVIFDIRYYGQPLFVKSLELYAVIVPSSR